MRTLFQNKEPDPLDEELTRILQKMSVNDPGSDEYKKMLASYEALHTQKTGNRLGKVSPDTLVTAGASLAGIAIIVMYEQRHVITSKAFTFLKL